MGEKTEEVKLMQVAGTPETLNLKGRDVKISPLEVSDLARMERWISEAPLRKVLGIVDGAAGRELITKEVKDKLVYEAVKEGTKLSMRSEDGQDMLQSLEGVRFVLWLSMSKADSSITLEDVFKLVDLQNLKAVGDSLDRVSGLKELNSGE